MINYSPVSEDFFFSFIWCFGIKFHNFAEVPQRLLNVLIVYFYLRKYCLQYFSLFKPGMYNLIHPNAAVYSGYFLYINH